MSALPKYDCRTNKSRDTQTHTFADQNEEKRGTQTHQLLVSPPPKNMIITLQVGFQLTFLRCAVERPTTEIYPKTPFFIFVFAYRLFSIGTFIFVISCRSGNLAQFQVVFDADSSFQYLLRWVFFTVYKYVYWFWRGPAYIEVGVGNFMSKFVCNFPPPQLGLIHHEFSFVIRPASRGESEQFLRERLSTLFARRVCHQRPFILRRHRGRICGAAMARS